MAHQQTLPHRTVNVWRRGTRLLQSKFILLVPVGIGVGVLAYAIATKKTPQQQPVEEIARTLTVARVVRQDVQPTVTGYGLARPSQIWRAVSQVDGTIIETHPRLKAGALVPSGTVLLRIDPTDYELEIGRLEAEIRNLDARIAELLRRKENDEATLEVEMDSLELASNEVARLRKMLPSRAASQSEFDRTRREWLAQKRSVQALANSLHLMPSQLKQAEANLAMARQRLQIAKRDLERTAITTPFDSRLATVDIEPGQYVATNEQLFEVHGVDRVEVEARIPIEDVGKLVSRHDDASTLTPLQWDDRYQDSSTSAIQDDASVYSMLQGLRATVRVKSGDWTGEWPAEIVRVREQIERRTRAVGVIVAIESGIDDAGGLQPPLLEGTFCEVVFEGQTRPSELVVPVSAVRDGRVYVVDAEDRLKPCKVKVKYTIGDRIVIDGDLSAGARIVLTNPSPAVSGMLVDAVDATSPQFATTAGDPIGPTPISLVSREANEEMP